MILGDVGVAWKHICVLNEINWVCRSEESGSNGDLRDRTRVVEPETNSIYSKDNQVTEGKSGDGDSKAI